jgi:histone demethylase JARID1
VVTATEAVAAQAAAAKAIDDIACELCGDTEDDGNMLLCDGCDNGYHMRCMGWKRKRAPKGAWYCDECALVAG